MDVVEEVIELDPPGRDSPPQDSGPESDDSDSCSLPPEGNSSADPSKKIIKCNVCNKILSSVRSLKRHVDSYHQNPQKCDICDKFFRNAQELSQHKKSHLGYECAVCGNKYTTADSLRAHKNKKHPNPDQQHSSEPVTCELCEKTFKNSDGLKTHKSRIHKDQ